MKNLTINGASHQVDVPDEMPLLWVIRDVVGLTGTKFGCGVAQCGACTVHLDGTAVRSCVTTATQAVGKKVTTIEGLAPAGSPDGLHALQRAWIEKAVPQCGYCQSGQMMSAAALLATKKTLSDADIDAGMSGNICRCGTYSRIKAAIKGVAELA